MAARIMHNHNQESSQDTRHKTKTSHQIAFAHFTPQPQRTQHNTAQSGGGGEHMRPTPKKESPQTTDRITSVVPWALPAAGWQPAVPYHRRVYAGCSLYHHIHPSFIHAPQAAVLHDSQTATYCDEAQ